MVINYLLKKAYFLCLKNESIPHYKKNIWQKVYYNGFKILLMIGIESVLRVRYILNANLFYPLIDDGKKPIVSLTTTPTRINSLWIVIYSIFHQTRPPAKIVLILTEEEFPEKMNNLPESLKKLLNIGLEVVFINFNLRPHNKYYYALNTYRDRNVITIDDDMFYWIDTIEKLLKTHTKTPNSICANLVMNINMTNNNYQIERVYEEGLSNTYMAQGVGGVLYPTLFRSTELFNIENIKQLSLTADDLWLKSQQLLLGINVSCSGHYPHPLLILGSQKVALWHRNMNLNESAKQWKKLCLHYNLIEICIN